jgi:hypothetical protein
MELGVAIAGLIIGAVALLLSSISLVLLIAKEKSTHTVQLTPVDTEIDRLNEEFLKNNRKGSWATSEEAIEKQKKMYQEEIEAEMPEFSLDEDDKEIFSL